MRKHTRPPEPDILIQKGATWNQQWLSLRQTNSSAQFSWYKHEGRSARDWILPGLKAMTQGHCAFCDTFPCDDQSLEPIEHFRPKHDPRFYNLAYSWSNLFYCCGRCQGEKGFKWEDDLLAPDTGDYRTEDYFEYDIETGEIMENRFASDDFKRRAQTTIEIFGLNRGNRPTRRREALARWLCSSHREIHDTPYRDFIQCGSKTAAEELASPMIID